MFIKTAIALVATSALAMKLVQRLSHGQQLRRARDDGKRHSDDVSRWEAEGGNPPAAQPVKRSARRATSPATED
ncbi:MAG: hypothetical protein ACT6S0_24755 [Roseateles sp.]|uniref:hypothetical protein n=1 Tax=Roseateles sp. TaxID=1971397 RepID=UPI0040356719